MYRKNLRRALLVIALAAALASTVFAAVSASRRSAPAAGQQEVAYNYKYLVAEYQGNVAVFTAGETVPSYITDTEVRTLPFADREMLAQGIEIYTEEELSLILEDYGT